MPDKNADVGLRIQALNPQRQPLGGTVDIELRPQGSGSVLSIKAADASKDIDVTGLQRTPQVSYLVTVTPTDVLVPVSQSVTVPNSGLVTVQFVVDKAGIAAIPSPTPTPRVKPVNAIPIHPVPPLPPLPPWPPVPPIPPTPPVPPPTPPTPTPVYSIPDTFAETALPAALTPRLTGTPANGVAGASATPPTSVIWVDGCNEVLVHLDSLQASILAGVVVISVDLETDQTGRTPLICAFAVSSGTDPAGLIAATDEYPRGDGRLAATWGKQVQQALWSSILSLSNDHAAERSLAPRGLAATPGTLTLVAGPPIAVKPV